MLPQYSFLCRCIKDKSLRFEDPPTDVNQYSNPELYFSFESFGFKNAGDAVSFNFMLH